MVRTTETGFSIEIDCNGHPANEYVEITNNIVEVLQAQDKELDSGNYHLLQLLQEMLPTFEQAKAMFDEIKDVPPSR